jgi:hypothetical protein
MRKVADILSGYKGYFIMDLEVEEVAKERAGFCAECEHAKEGLHSVIVPDMRIKEISGHYCGLCYCPLPAIVRSKGYKCKAGKW